MTVYGNLNLNTFMTTNNPLEIFQYQLSLPLDVVFDPIDHMSELFNVASQLMSEAQKCSIVFIILKTQEFLGQT